MKGLPSAENAAYSDICEYFEQRMGNPQWKGFPQFAVTVELIRVYLAKRFNIAPNTVSKWQSRTDFNDRSHTAHNLQTTLNPLINPFIIVRKAT